MITRVSDGSMTHGRKENTFTQTVSTSYWVEVKMTICGLAYIRKNHPLVRWVLPNVTRLYVTADLIDCMTCLVRMDES